MTLKPILLSLTFSVFALLTGCEANETDVCGTDNGGLCPDGWYSCPQSNTCYESQIDCQTDDQCDV